MIQSIGLDLYNLYRKNIEYKFKYRVIQNSWHKRLLNAMIGQDGSQPYLCILFIKLFSFDLNKIDPITTPAISQQGNTN